MFKYFILLLTVITVGCTSELTNQERKDAFYDRFCTPNSTHAFALGIFYEHVGFHLGEVENSKNSDYAVYYNNYIRGANFYKCNVKTFPEHLKYYEDAVKENGISEETMASFNGMEFLMKISLKMQKRAKTMDLSSIATPEEIKALHNTGGFD